MMTVEEMEARVAQLGYTLNKPRTVEYWGCGDYECCGPSYDRCVIDVEELPESYGDGYDYEEALANLLYDLEMFYGHKNN